MSAPIPEDAQALTDAAVSAYGPCTCSPAHRRMCAAHDFLLDDPTRRGLVKQWQRLLWMRAEREHILAQEGVPTLAPTRVESAPDPNKLPW